MSDPYPLTPKQRDILERLLDRGGSRPVFDPGLAGELTAALEAQLADAVPWLPESGRFVVGKHKLSLIADCEGKYAAEADTFEWTRQNCRGTIAHRAMERLIMSGDPSAPMDLGEGAVAYLAQDDEAGGLGRFLQSLGEDERHELVLGVSDLVTKFAVDWPPISRQWRPRIESRSKFSFFDGRLELNTKVDLALGFPSGSEARTFIVDFKTGAPVPSHGEDLRFYALVETLARGTPPFRVASYYLDSGTSSHEDISAEVLWRTVDMVVPRIVDMCRVKVEGPAVLNPNRHCRWCAALEQCDVGQKELEGSR